MLEQRENCSRAFELSSPLAKLPITNGHCPPSAGQPETSVSVDVSYPSVPPYMSVSQPTEQ